MLRRVGDLRDDQPVGHRLDPGDLRQRVQVRLDRLAGGPQIHRARPALLAAQHVERDVGRNPVEPRSQRRPALEAIESAPGADEGLLHRILGVERRAEHPVAIRLELRPMLLELLLELARVGLDLEGRILHDAHRTRSAHARR